MVVTSVVSLSVCHLSHVRSQKLSEIGTKFHCLCMKSGLPSKNLMLDFAPEVAKYPRSSHKLQNSPKLGSRQLSEISMEFRHRVAEEEYNVRFCTGSS